MDIRPACREELDAIFDLVRRAVVHMNQLGNPQWGDDYPTWAHYEGDLRRGELYVAETGDKLLGVACINTDQAPEYASIAWRIPGPAVVIHRMAVDPTAQRQGVGRAFFYFAQDCARRWGINTLHIDTYSQNVRMQAALRSMGFVQVGEINLHGRPLKYPCFEKMLGYQGSLGGKTLGTEQEGREPS